MKKFKIHSYKSKLYFWVIIHDTIDELYKEGLKYKRNSGASGWVKGADGLFHSYEKFIVDNKSKKSKKSNDIGIIRLHGKSPYPRTVYHEVLHAALWQYRLKHRKKADFGSMIDDKEEELAAIYHDLLSRTVFNLYKFKLW